MVGKETLGHIRGGEVAVILRPHFLSAEAFWGILFARNQGKKSLSTAASLFNCTAKHILFLAATWRHLSTAAIRVIFSNTSLFLNPHLLLRVESLLAGWGCVHVSTTRWENGRNCWFCSREGTEFKAPRISQARVPVPTPEWQVLWSSCHVFPLL